jgi:hypothetical protein
LKLKLICIFILLFTVEILSDIHHQIRLTAGTEGFGPEYRFLAGLFFVNGSALVRFNLIKPFTNTDSSNSNLIRFSPEMEIGGSIPVRENHLIAPFIGVALPFESFHDDSSLGLNYSTFYRFGVNLFWLREKVSFFNVGFFLSLDRNALYGIGVRLGVTILDKSNGKVIRVIKNK